MKRRLQSVIQPLLKSHDEFRAETGQRLDETFARVLPIEAQLTSLAESVLYSRWLQTPDYLASRDEAGHWLNWLGLSGNGVEVGVFRGEYSNQILRTWKCSNLTSIDPWRAFPASDYVDSCNMEQSEHDRNFEMTKATLSRFASRSTILRLTSREAAARFTDASLDFVYIDAQHHYEAVRDDIALWLPKVKKGGVLGGHDYLEGMLASGKYGVMRAVKELVDERHYKLVITHEPDWPSWYVIVA